MAGFDVESALNGLKALVETVPAMESGDVRPRSSREHLADGLTDDAALCRQFFLSDAPLGVSIFDVADQIVGQQRFPLSLTSLQRFGVTAANVTVTERGPTTNHQTVRRATRYPVPLNSIPSVLRLCSRIQVQRTNTADSAAVTVVQDARRFRWRFMAGGQNVGDDVSASLPTVDVSGTVPIAVLAAQPDPTRAALRPEGRAVLIDLRPESVSRCTGMAAFGTAKPSLAFSDTTRCFGEGSTTPAASQMNARRILTGHRSHSFGVTPPAVTSSAGALSCAEWGRTRTFPPGASSPECPFGLLILGDNWRVNSLRPCPAAWNRRATTQRLNHTSYQMRRAV